ASLTLLLSTGAIQPPSKPLRRGRWRRIVISGPRGRLLLRGPIGAAGLLGRHALAGVSARTAPGGGAAPAPAADFGHVPAVHAHLFPALASRGAGLVRGELVGLALLVSRPPALAGDLLLAMGVHRREAAVARPRLLFLSFHKVTTP